MPTLDWIFLALFLGSMVVGAWRGLMYEVLALLNWLAAFWLAQYLGPVLAQYLPWHAPTEGLQQAAGLVLVFIVALFAGGLLAALVRKLVVAAGLRPVDRTLGAGFGLLRAGLVALAAAVFISLTPWRQSAWWRDSTGASISVWALQQLQPMLPQDYGQYLQQVRCNQTGKNLCAE